MRAAILYMPGTSGQSVSHEHVKMITTLALINAKQPILTKKDTLK